MPQYKHDRFSKLYVQALYQNKGRVEKDVTAIKDEDLKIDVIFHRELSNEAWQTEELGLLDTLMRQHQRTIIEHYSGYLTPHDIDTCATRKYLYWEVEKKKIEENFSRKQEQKRVLRREEPFTWILTANCSEKTLTGSSVVPDKSLGEGIYLLSPDRRIGIVVIEDLPNPTDNYWLKILGKKESCQLAFQQIQQLPVTKRERNDIIKVCTRYAAYLKGIPVESITSQEREFMKTLEEIDAFFETYPSELLAAKECGKLEGKIESAKTIIRAKFDAAALTEEVASRVARLNEEQLNSLNTLIFQWQKPADMLAWLDVSLPDKK